MTVLQSVPWSDVIRNAPKVADGARKLWNTVAKKPQDDAPTQPAVRTASAPDVTAVAALQSRFSSMESAIADLHAQMLASSELIKALADQNAQLIRRAETARVRSLWLAAAVALVGLLALASLVWIGSHAHV
ncbi:MAG TPA: hypothetical protein VFK10_20160 [Burkholderiaceae bacterium]|nr:hypothetical protein [Burkholderiaceae bacterium]